MKRIVVIGGGTMGLDVVQVSVRNGYDVVVRDTKGEIIRASKARLSKDLDRLMGKSKPDEARKAKILSHMSSTTEPAVAVDANLVVEAAIENLDIKKSILAELDSPCKPETILVSNTSSISTITTAAVTKRPDKFTGTRFFNPVTVMKPAGVIRGVHTSDETYKTIAELAAVIGKKPIEVNEVPGFAVNKILAPMINEGIDLVYTGVASVEGMDIAMKPGANHPMGLLALGDLTGLDAYLVIMDILYDEAHDPKYHASLLLHKMVRADKLGRKTGIGFYDYSKK